MESVRTACKELKCEGKQYRTRLMLTCPLHQLAYTIELEHRVSKARQYIHPIMKRGHSNWLEASHNVFIRFRSKALNLERLHYEVATNLALLQSNLTYLTKKKGRKYHWITELYRRMQLPVYDGLIEKLETSNKTRTKGLEHKKKEEIKRRRIELKCKRTKEAQARKQWSKGHANYDYHGADQDIAELEGKHNPREDGHSKNNKVCGKCKCGSTSHKRTSHRDCPLKKSKGEKKVLLKDEAVNPQDDYNPKLVPTSGKSDEQLPPANDQLVVKDEAVNLKDDHDPKLVPTSDDQLLDDIASVASQEVYDSDGDIDNYSDSEVEGFGSEFSDSIEECECGASTYGWVSHKKYCPMSSRLRYTSYRTSSRVSVTESKPRPLPKKRRAIEETSDCGQSAKRIKLTKAVPKFVPGDYVSLHSDSQSHCHLPCRIIELIGTLRHMYRLCCGKGVLKTLYKSDKLTPLATTRSISLYEWPLLPKVSAKEAISCQELLEACTCKVGKTHHVVVTTCTNDSDGHSIEDPDIVWIRNLRITLYNSQKERLVSCDRWLDDKLIDAAQFLIAEQFPGVSGLQTVCLQAKQGFDIQRQSFVQVLNVSSNHWITVSNVGCKEGEVNVYNSLLGCGITRSVKASIASIVFCPSSPLCLNYMDVTQQRNSYDCGVFSIAYAYDVSRGKDPCQVDYNHKMIRRHLTNCFENNNITEFPSVGDRSIVDRVRLIETVELHCVCRMPAKGAGEEDMAECDRCNVWFHKQCLDIPNDVFSDEDICWTCTQCKQATSSSKPF